MTRKQEILSRARAFMKERNPILKPGRKIVIPRHHFCIDEEWGTEYFCLSCVNFTLVRHELIRTAEHFLGLNFYGVKKIGIT
jgi:hypothetical protein